LDYIKFTYLQISKVTEYLDIADEKSYNNSVTSTKYSNANMSIIYGSKNKHAKVVGMHQQLAIAHTDVGSIKSSSRVSLIWSVNSAKVASTPKQQ